ncbi:Piwi domain-containing protein [Schizophyllum fasciatum]
MSRAQGQPGPVGRPLSVITNHVAVKRLPTKTHYLYTAIYYVKDGAWKEEKHSEKRIRVMDKLQTVVLPAVFDKCVFDGMNLLFVPHALSLPGGGPNATAITVNSLLTGPLAQIDVNMSDNPSPSQNAISRVMIAKTAHEGISPTAVNQLIRRAAQVGAPTPDALQAINLLQLIIRQHSVNLMKPAVNAKAFFTDKEKTDLGGGIELWRGFFQSVRPTIGRLLINIDTTVAPFIASRSLMDFMIDIIGKRHRNARDLELSKTDQDFKRLERAVKKLHITVRFNNSKTKIIRGLEPHAGRFSFYNEQRGMETTIEAICTVFLTTPQAHYREAYNFSMRFPKIVGVRLTGPNAPRPVIVPAELCTIKPNQFYKKKLSEDMTAKAVKWSTLKPVDRKRKIEQGLQGDVPSPIAHYQQSSYVRDAGMEIGRQLESVQGRMLPPPQLYYGRDASERPTNGQWNMVRKHLAEPRTMDNWAIVNFAEQLPVGVVNSLVVSLARACGDIDVQAPISTQPFFGTGQNIEKPMKEALNILRRDRPALILVFLPSNAKGIRQGVKHFGDIVHGVITQCVRQNKVEKANNQYFNNVAIKLNARLGGAMAQVRSDTMNQIKAKPYMIVGADVSHPAPGQMRPSMISVVYSTDADATRYSAITDIQEARTERIEGMRKYAYEAVVGFARRNNPDGKIKVFPVRLIIYRDGISEGEFAHVATQEVQEFKAGIDDALNEFKAQGRAQPDLAGPLITYIVVGKRHHVVFFPQQSSDSDGRTGNLPSGFVTDSGLDSPFAPDFFLQSHSAIQGTSRSSHYVVLHDENWGFGNIDAIKQLSFHLCHTYAKATRAVSIPAPVYYADLACARGAFHFAGNEYESDTGASEVDLSVWRQHFCAAHRNLKNMMYFL